MTYGLVTLDGEVILKVNRDSFDDAIEHFSSIKRLSKDKLLSIFDVINIKPNQLN